jgi:ubiquinone/menaquinone biosynthesis C-methylase UbiE
MASFRVEKVLELRGCVYVFATRLDDAPFSVKTGARLGGVAVEPWLEQPRALDHSAAPRLDCFVFALSDPADRDRLAPGQQVDLTGNIEELPTREGYDRWALVYDDEDNPLVKLEQRETAHLLGGLAGKEIVDLGCGTGRWTLAMAAAGARVTAVDFSAEMLARARAKPGAERVSFVVHDITRPLPFAAASFDGATCCLVLDHIADPRALLAELARVVRPGGFVLITVMHPAMMLRGIQAQFIDPETGARVRPASAPNQIADYVMAAVQAVLSIERLSEHAVDADLAAASARGARYLGWPLLLVMELRRRSG